MIYTYREYCNKKHKTQVKIVDTTSKSKKFGKIKIFFNHFIFDEKSINIKSIGVKSIGVNRIVHGSMGVIYICDGGNFYNTNIPVNIIMSNVM